MNGEVRKSWKRIASLEVTEAGIRADQLILTKLRERWPALSRTRLKPALQNNDFRLGGRKVRAADVIPTGIYELELEERALQDLEASLETNAHPSARGAFLPIVYEDDSLLVIHKFAGVPSVPHQARETETAVGAALAHAPALSLIGKSGLEPGLLHRLDTGTSGLLVFAKNQLEYDRLKLIWGRGEVRKNYRAVCEGSGPLPEPPSEYRLLLGHDPGSSKKMVIYHPARKTKTRGKPLPTVTRILRATRLPAADARPSSVDFEIEIETGVMHQIRATLAHLEFPILGDPIYRGEKAERLWLHAWKLTLPLKNGTLLKLQAQLPEDWPGTVD